MGNSVAVFVVVGKKLYLSAILKDSPAKVVEKMGGGRDSEEVEKYWESMEEERAWFCRLFNDEGLRFDIMSQDAYDKQFDVCDRLFAESIELERFKTLINSVCAG